VAVVWILLPSAVGLFVLKGEILSLFFEHGNFPAADICRALPIVSIYCIGMVFSGMSSLFIRGFHSLKNTTIPAFIGVAALVVSAALSLALMRFFGIIGLAIATTSATIFQTICLVILFGRKMRKISLLGELKNYKIILRGSITVGIVAVAVKFSVGLWCHFPQRTNCALVIFCAVPLALLAYLFVSRKLVAKVFEASKIKE
jgi:putative peptidoglycan lipid II flippase